MQERVRENQYYLGGNERERKPSMVTLPEHLERMMRSMNQMEMTMSLMTETKVDQVQVEERSQRSLLKRPRVSSMMRSILKR